jgi:hypothetical protein
VSKGVYKSTTDRTSLVLYWQWNRRQKNDTRVRQQ